MKKIFLLFIFFIWAASAYADCGNCPSSDLKKACYDAALANFPGNFDGVYLDCSLTGYLGREIQADCSTICGQDACASDECDGIIVCECKPVDVQWPGGNINDWVYVSDTCSCESYTEAPEFSFGTMVAAIVLVAVIVFVLRKKQF